MIVATILDSLSALFQIEGKPISLLLRIALALAGLALLAYLAFFLTKSVLQRALEALGKRTPFTWDDHLIDAKFLFWSTQLVPGIVVYIGAPIALAGQPQWIDATQFVATVYLLIVGYLALGALLNAGVQIYRTFPISREIPIRGFVQVAKLLLTLMLIIILISMMMGKSPLYLISGLGALTAILMLIFKDSILGLVAGIQLAANRMVARGDWIAMPKFGADGTVLDVALTTVKVQNWDKTVTTIPTYALISDSFKNWRGMQESGGRRIKRALSIDVTTIRFADDAMLHAWSQIHLLAPYLEERRRQLDDHNREHHREGQSLANGRHLTNIGTFRAYMEAYLHRHPLIAPNLTLLVRQLAPTQHGLPIEIYAFSSDTNWAAYEAIQADIFDHLFAILPEFHLKAFQRPAGSDLQALSTP